MNPFATLAKADRQLRTIRKANPSQSLGGIVIPDGHRTPAPVGKITPDELILKGFKANVFAYTCVDRLASFAAQAFWRVEERVGENEWQPREGDWRNKLLAYPMGSKVSAQEVFYYFGAWLAIAGNGLLRKIPGGLNGILELVPMTPKNIEPIPDREEWISGYNLIEDGKVKFNYPAEEIVHARLPDPSNPLWGFGMMEAAWRSILSDNASADWRTKSMQAGGVPPVAIIDEELSPNEAPAQAAALRIAFRRNALDRSPMLMGGKKTIEQFGFTPSDMEIPEDRALTMGEIVNAFGMHPSIFSNDSATFDNMDAGIRYSYENGVGKILSITREALNLGLLTDEERESDSVYINFDLSQIPFFRRQRESKIAAMGTAIRSGVSRNDYVIMADLGLDPADGGDAVFIESGLTLLSEAAEGVESGAEQDPPFPPSNQPNPFAPKEEPEPEGDEDAPPAE